MTGEMAVTTQSNRIVERIPRRVAFALQADGWYLRQDIIWHKNNPMPESVTDRCTKAHEYMFLLSKNQKYYYDAEAIKEPGADTEYTRERYKYKPSSRSGDRANPGVDDGVDRFSKHFGHGKRNRRSVWTIPTCPFKSSHFATFPPDLVNPCILAGSKPGDIVLDPFGGSGTVAMRAKALSRKYIHIDLGYEPLAQERLAQEELF